MDIYEGMIFQTVCDDYLYKILPSPHPPLFSSFSFLFNVGACFFFKKKKNSQFF